MSIISTQANYGGRQPNNTSYIKQFVVSPSNKTIPWVIKTVSNVQYIEPSISTKPLLISQDVFVNNLTVEGTFTNLSDANYKENVTPIDDENTITIINSLTPCKYNMKENMKENKETPKTHYGLIAQELEEICPELVITHSETNNAKTVNYIELIPFLIKNIQYLNNEIFELKKELSSIKNKQQQ